MEAERPPRGGPLARLGLGRRELLGWASYDWANSAFYTVVVTAVYPIFFGAYAVGEGVAPGVASSRHAMATFWSLLVVALLSPFLGAMADYGGVKKKLLALFLLLGVAATGGLWLVGPGDWELAAVLFAVANVGVVGSVVFYDSLLPHVARDEELDRVSAAGFALGYLGGGLLLAGSVWAIAQPQAFGFPDVFTAMRWSFLAVALWWAVFSLPLFLWVREPPRRLEADERLGMGVARVAVTRLAETFRELRQYRQAFLLLLAVMVYADGIGTIIRMATLYGEELGLPRTAMIGAVLMIQFLGIPFTLLFGALGSRIGTRRAIFLGLAVYVGISVYGYFLRSAVGFFVLGAMVAMVMGGTQALSRSLFASVVPRHKTSEFFGFFAIFEKFAGILGPLLFAVLATQTGSTRNAILGVVAFFVVGAALLALVDVDEGRRVARAAELEVRRAAPSA
ncbi:MAG TPA: MFS transporter, partial [Thermoanaerobaculia bacterium]|nr:MFS transporter [Thermoanaerobaculia bacterium]